MGVLRQREFASGLEFGSEWERMGICVRMEKKTRWEFVSVWKFCVSKENLRK